jgi:hypothetical protein
MVTHPNRKRRVTATQAVAQATPAPAIETEHDIHYAAMRDDLPTSFLASIASVRGVGREPAPRLFCTDATGLYETYLGALGTERQVHTCHACRRFIEAFGGLALITENGLVTSPLWNAVHVPSFYQPAFAAMANAVSKARVTGVFLSSKKTLGTPVTGKWHHLSVTLPGAMVYREGAKTADQAAAALKENVRIVRDALGEFSPAALDQAIRILEADAVSRAERFLAPVQWLRALHDRPKGPQGENLLWRAVASAPDGYCHPRASMTGTLLEDIIAGLPFEDIKRRFNAKMHPLQYQRPQAAPTAGNIAAAEKLVEKMGLAPSLERRFARLEDLQEPLWKPTPDASPPSATGPGVFGHLKPKAAPPEVREVELPPVTMTWVKFKAEVLPKATAIDFHVPAHGNFVALTAAQNADAPPIMKWDRDDARNTVSLYVYSGGSPARQWGLSQAVWQPLTAITAYPWLWGDTPMPHIAEGDILVIQGAADTRTTAGTALFPEFLLDDLREVRATIEAFSKTAKFHGAKEATACGWSMPKEGAQAQLRAKVSGAWNRYSIDRWN